MSDRPNLQSDSRLGKVMEQRARRMPNPVASVAHVEGAHVWAAAGLQGFPGGSPMNTWAHTGLRDAFQHLRDKQHDPQEWVTTVANALNRKG